MAGTSTPPDPPDHIRHLPNSVAVVATSGGDVLVHCPPETLKYLLHDGLIPPSIIVLPVDLTAGQELGSSGFVRRGINYASVEFLIYSNFFGQQRKTRLVTVTEHQARRLRTILNETIRGPADPEDYGEFAWVQQECAAVGYYAPLGRMLLLEDLVEIVSLEAGGGDFGVTQLALEDDHFAFREAGRVIARLTTQITTLAVPLHLAPPRPLQRQEITLQFIGGSDGFDPSGITTCFLAYLGSTVQTQATLFDAAAYVVLRLGNLGVSPSHISAVVLSHLHEDHLAGLPELILMGSHRVRLVTSTLIYRSLLRILEAMLDVPANQVAALFDFYCLDPGTPLELEGRHFEAIYAIHSIPTIAVRVQGICYSGDMRYDEAWFSELEAQGVLLPWRREQLMRFAEGASILVQDVGGGAIHTTMSAQLLQTLTAKSQRLVLAHTNKNQLPEDSDGLGDRIAFAGSGMVVGMGAHVPGDAFTEMVETIAACPIFARLPIGERLILASQVEVVNWADGDVILHQGDPSDGVTYIVHSGLVAIDMDGAQMRLLGRGSSIGERGALLGEARSTTMHAHGELQLLKLTPEVFLPIANTLHLVEACTRADWMAELPMLRSLPWASLLDLALDFQPYHLLPGDILFLAGEPGYEGYLLVSGMMRLLDPAGNELAVKATPGTFIGGYAALSGEPRRTSALAVTPVVVWSLPASTLERLNLLYPHLLLHLRTIVE
ncbi:cyclic nucleotide-binding domain-containing protein [Candidatus Chloroploca asiatica]|uniref:Cyclic nucleotide-binding protein n=1 Tax=Candidatus Chloroploca asiatica TaxID=1506545 RepID=A0A2H3KL47_9CHLR|nr:cyclic nucleotide-binding domain-containing protein [Candidatus Chloroploca asiatica]PDV97977.1 cyclic nucleotide-binding protein [Candidatus Chloroploca asiatica]